jgi:hypothetical protein
MVGQRSPSSVALIGSPPMRKNAFRSPGQQLSPLLVLAVGVRALPGQHAAIADENLKQLPRPGRPGVATGSPLAGGRTRRSV